MFSQLLFDFVLQYATIIASTLLPDNPFPTSAVQNEALFDFIVVGSGASGSAVAGRLAEIPNWNVLLLEAGGQQRKYNKVPGLNLFSLVPGSKDSWHYRTARQKHSMFNYENHSNLFPRGKVVGGSSAVNFMMYVRGNPKDYDRWQELGNPGWDYASVLPYFKKSENFKGKVTKATAPYHSRGGPLNVENKSFGTPVMGTFLRAGQELGYPVIDPNAGRQIGFSTPDMTIKNGVRSSVAEGFLRPALEKRNSNLKLVLRAHVTKIIFDRNNRAIGVRYLHRNKMKEAYARKEVIVSGGSINSPQLLMLSGLGPKEHLRQHGIKTLVDLPGVGQNMQDHPSIFGLTWTVDKGKGSSYGLILNPKSKSMYRKHRKGPLSVVHAVEGNAWAHLSPGGDPDWPDIQFLILSMHPAIDSRLVLSASIGYTNEVYRKYFRELEKSYGFCIGPMLTVPDSRGSVTLRSSNPLHAPLIDPNYLSEPQDVVHFVRAIRFALAIGNTTAMRRDLNAKFHDKPLPGCEQLPYGSDSYWACFTRRMASTTYHPVSTCKMAPANDPMGVVDHRLKVRGVTGLRVVDASIMPIIVSGNTNAPCIMIGEKGADLIKEDHGVL